MNDLKILDETCFFLFFPTHDQIRITKYHSTGVVSSVVSFSPILQSRYIPVPESVT